MTEHPIIFSADMVKAVMDGRKTQTRRVMKPQPSPHYSGGLMFIDAADMEIGWYRHCWDHASGVRPVGDPIRCPYGKPGDRLWVRETFVFGDREPCDCLPAACTHLPAVHYRADWGGIDDDVRWRPSIYMPRWASRINLEVVNVRVERVQEISEEDAKAEGIKQHEGWWLGSEHCAKGTPKVHALPTVAFRDLWDSINAKRGYGWESNPWVWVVEFRSMEGTG